MIIKGTVHIKKKKSDILFAFCLDDDGDLCMAFSVDYTKCNTHDWKEFRSSCLLKCSCGVELMHTFSQCLNLSLCFFLLLPAAHPHAASVFRLSLVEGEAVSVVKRVSAGWVD